MAKAKKPEKPKIRRTKTTVVNNFNTPVTIGKDGNVVDKTGAVVGQVTTGIQLDDD